MSRLASLRRAYAEQNLWLQVLLGVVSETGQVARALPGPDARLRSARPQIDLFVAALLGAVSLRAQLHAAADESAEPRWPRAADLADSSAHGRRPGTLPVKPGDLMR